MPLIKLPYEFDMREYQRETFEQLFVNRILRQIWVWHRRAGKTKNIVNTICASAMERVGNYYHLFPLLNQGKRNVWTGIDKEGKRFLDHFPKHLIKGTPNNSEMSITFVNGSTFQLLGSDKYNKLMGSNPIGVIFDEYSLQNPQVWEYVRPILAENGGWAIFAFTPRGRNHAKKLLDKVRTNKKWFVSIKTVFDTKDTKGNRIITDEMINDEREAGMSEEKIQQEFFCSFEYGIEGAYYSDQIKFLRENHRIKNFEIKKNLPVYTFWDIGFNDYTSIWFFYKDGSFPTFISYYQNCGKGYEHYFEELKKFEKTHGIRFDKHFVPHDAKNKYVQTNGKSLIEIAAKHGVYMSPIPKISLQDGINAVRSFLPKVVFHEKNCENGIECLTQYHKEYDEDLKMFKDHPEHDWSSHGADGFRMAAILFNPKLWAHFDLPLQNQTLNLGLTL